MHSLWQVYARCEDKLADAVYGVRSTVDASESVESVRGACSSLTGVQLNLFEVSVNFVTYFRERC